MQEMNKSQIDLNHDTLEFSGLSLILLKQKAVWIPNLQILLLADLHFGKAAHFRKSGIPIPEPIHDIDLFVVKNLLDQYQPKQIYFLGNLFHF